MSNSSRRGFSLTACRDENHTVTCPAFAESISEGDIRFEKAVGDAVAVDEVVCEVETDKTSVPVPSPVAGKITELLVEDGSTVKPGMPLVVVEVGAAGAAPAAAGPIPTTPPPAPPTPAEPMASIPVAAIRHAQNIEPAAAPAAASGPAPIVRMPSP